MSSDEPTIGTTNPRRRILWLVVVHVVVGLIGAFVAYFAGGFPRCGERSFSASSSVKRVCWESGAVLERVRGGAD